MTPALNRNDYESAEEYAAALCRNWGRWATWGQPPWPHDPRVCASVERGYPIPVWENESTPPPEPLMLEGEAIESLVSNLQAVQPVLAKLLQVHYAKLPDSAVRAVLEARNKPFSHEQADWMRAIRCKVAPHEYPSLLSKAHEVVLRLWPQFWTKTSRGSGSAPLTFFRVSL